MGELIPLFPLGRPLFPGAVLPLQIFEPRYRRLMRDLLGLPEHGDRRFFGVVAIRQGWEVERVAPAAALYDVGCAAQLRRVQPQPDGGFRVVAVGGERFRLLDVVVGDDPPYLQGEVEWLAEEEAAGDAERVPTGPDAGDPPADDVVASVTRNSLTLLSRGSASCSRTTSRRSRPSAPVRTATAPRPRSGWPPPPATRVPCRGWLPPPRC